MDASFFRFAVGQRVTWLRGEPEVWMIYVRMLLEDAQGTDIQYGIRPADRPDMPHELWAREADLVPYPHPLQE